MTREEALRTYTINGAYAAFEEEQQGVACARQAGRHRGAVEGHHDSSRRAEIPTALRGSDDCRRKNRFSAGGTINGPQTDHGQKQQRDKTAAQKGGTRHWDKTKRDRTVTLNAVLSRRFVPPFCAAVLSRSYPAVIYSNRSLPMSSELSARLSPSSRACSRSDLSAAGFTLSITSSATLRTASSFSRPALRARSSN